MKKSIFVFYISANVFYSIGQRNFLDLNKKEAFNELGKADKLLDFGPFSFDKAAGDIIFVEDFGNGMSNWSTAGTDGVIWQFDTGGPSGQYSGGANEVIQSTTVSNGFVIFDADEASPGAGPHPNRMGSLVSPVINLSGLSNVILQFEHRYRSCCSQQFYPKLEVSTDGFTTFTEYNLSIPGTFVNTIPSTTKMKINLSSFLSSATNLTNFQFRFTFDGTMGTTHYYWQIDDIELFESHNNDLTALSKAFSSGSQNLPYYFIPINQQTEITFSGEVRNDGANTQTGVQLIVTSDNGLTVSSPQQSLSSGVQDSLITSVWNPGAISPTTHNLTYTFSQNEQEATNSDNSLSETIYLTNSVYSVDNGIVGGSIGNLSNQANQPFKIGNVMEIMSDDNIDSMYIAVTSTSSNIGQEIFGEIWRDNGTDWEYLGSTTYIEITASNNGTLIKLPLTQIIQVNAGDVLLVVACHSGGSVDDVRFRTAQPVNEGDVLGFDASGDPFYLTTPRAIMVRLNLNEDASMNEENLSDMSGNIYPNPGNGTITINYNLLHASDVKIELKDITGKVVYTADMLNQAEGGHTIKLYASEYSEGVYMLNVSSGYSNFQKKFIRNH